MTDEGEDLLSRLQQLQSHFTWDLKLEDLGTEEQGEDQEPEQEREVSHCYSFLAYVRYLQGRPEEAESILSQSEKKTRECYGEESETRFIVTYGDLAWLKYHSGDYTQSQSYCQRVQDILVKYPVASSTDHHPEVYGEKAWTYLKLSKSFYNKAIDCFHRALEQQPDDCDWNTGYAVVLYRTEEDITLTTLDEESPATKQLRRALEINPDDAILLSLLALKLINYQKQKEAEGLLERALVTRPDDSQVIRYVSKYLRKQGQLDPSIDLLQRTLKSTSDRQSAFIHHQLALCYHRKKKNLLPLKPCPEREVRHWRRLCIQHLEEALRLKSNLKHAKTILALLYAEEKNNERAQEMFDEVLEEVEEETGGMRQFIYRYYAEFCHYHKFQKGLTISYYTKGLQISATTSEGRHCIKKLKKIADQRLCKFWRDSVAYGILGTVAKAEGDWRRAEEYYQKALKGDRNNEEYLSALHELQLELERC